MLEFKVLPVATDSLVFKRFWGFRDSDLWRMANIFMLCLLEIFLWWLSPHIWARFLSLARSKLRLCSANHRPGYWSNLPCDWLSTAWAYSEQETENRPRTWRCARCCRWGADCIHYLTGFNLFYIGFIPKYIYPRVYKYFIMLACCWCKCYLCHIIYLAFYQQHEIS